ncbi:hypothetical protein ACJX0J_009988, partial [Zea mays]
LVCAYDANLKQVTVVAVTTISVKLEFFRLDSSLIVDDNKLLLYMLMHSTVSSLIVNCYTHAHQTRAHHILAGYFGWTFYFLCFIAYYSLHTSTASDMHE